MAKLVALVLFILTVAAAPAHAWTNPLLMSFPGQSAKSHSVGIDGEGNAFVVVQGPSDGIFVNTRGADETVGEPLRINAGHGQFPRIATNAGGVSAIAWIGTDGPDARVRMRLRRPNGAYTVETVISPAGADASSVEVGIDDAGDAFVSWLSTTGSDTRTYLRAKNGTTGALGSLLAISPPTGSNTTPHLAVEPGGRAYVTYVRDATIFGRARSTTGALSSAADMTGGPDTIFAQSMSLDGSGQALVAWSSGNADDRVRARTRSATGHLGAIATLSTGGTDVVTDNVLSVPGAVAWMRYTPDNRWTLQLRRLVGAAWQPIENITPSAIKPANVAAAAGGGRIVLAFTSFEDDGFTVRLRARERRPDGSLGPLSILSAENGNGGGPPRVAMNGSGQAAANWIARLPSEAFDLVWAGTNFLL